MDKPLMLTRPTVLVTKDADSIFLRFRDSNGNELVVVEHDLDIGAALAEDLQLKTQGVAPRVFFRLDHDKLDQGAR